MISSGTTKAKLKHGDAKIKRVYAGDTRIYSSGNTVTYIVNGISNTQDCEEGESVLNYIPPDITGAAFQGWSLSPHLADIEHDLIMGDTPLTLYSVYKYNDYDTGFTYDNAISFNDNYQSGLVTLYQIDPKYTSHTVTGSIYGNINVSNNTTGNVYMYLYVDETVIRSFRNGDPDTRNMVEYQNTPGYGGKTFTLTSSGDLTVRGSSGGWDPNGAYIKITGLILHGGYKIG